MFISFSSALLQIKIEMDDTSDVPRLVVYALALLRTSVAD